MYPPAWAGRLNKSLDDIYKEDGEPTWNRTQAINDYSFDMNKTDYPHDVLVMWEFDQLVKLRTNLPFECLEKTDLELLSLAYSKYWEVAGGISNEINDLWKGFDGNKVIGLHVRMTDEFAKNKGKVLLINYYKALDNIIACSPDTGIFLATDNI